MRVLYVTSEAAPFAASGGLGDVMGALPAAAVGLDKQVAADVILPLYGSVKEQYRAQMEKVCDLSFAYGWRQTGASIFRLPYRGVCYYFVENHYYFQRNGLYGQPDDGERFAFFSMAVLELLLSGQIPKPDILHANDWQAAMAVIYLKTEYAHHAALSGIRTLYTIHNIEYQGKFDPYILGDIFALDAKYYHYVEYDGCINLMKGALTLSDYINTVSPNYANELHHDFFAFGLSRIIDSVGAKMCGIINGIDYSVFSPENGTDIDVAYGEKDLLPGKQKNKLALQRALGLREDASIPMIAMITRLTAGKGVDLVLHILDELLEDEVQFVLLGTGDRQYEEAFASIGARHKNCAPLIKFDRVLSKKIYASADIFLMPSKSEPCGLSQMIACSYGTVPVVRAVGGLYDSIHPVGGENANGYTFNNFNAHELLFTLRRALQLYQSPEEWEKLALAAKRSDFSWESSAAQYLKIYNNLLNW